MTKRFISVRLTEEEFQQVYRRCDQSTSQSLTEYAKKVLTGKPVTFRVRNQSQDELLETLVGIKSRLDELAEHAEEKTQTALLQEIIATRSLIRQIAEKWCQ